MTPAEAAPYATRIVVYRPDRPGALSRHRRRGVAQRLGRVRHRAGLARGAQRRDPGRRHLDRRLGPGRAACRATARPSGGLASGGLKATDPDRYGSLHHPGDSFSYDIFSQVGQLARGGVSPDPLGGAPVTTVLAIGESQSAFRLVTYVNAVHPSAPVFDGFLSTAAPAAPPRSRRRPLTEIPAPDGTIVRSDLDVPVLVFQTETEFTLLSYLPARQPDTEHIRIWEVAGTAHADAYTAGIGFNDTGNGRAEEQLLDVGSIDGGPLACGRPINAGPGVRGAAGRSSTRSSVGLPVATRRPSRRDSSCRPPTRRPSPSMRTATPSAASAPHWSTSRSPRLRGDGNDGESFCHLFGTTTPFDAAQLRALYPNHAAYTSQFDESADAAVRDGFLLREEADNLKRAAARSTVPGT